MLTDEERARIRRAHQQGMSIRGIARRFHHGRAKIREVLQNPQSRGYVRTRVYRPKLTEEFCRRIEEILASHSSTPPAHRPTAAAIFRQLQHEGYQGGYDQVRRHVARHRNASPNKPR